MSDNPFALSNIQQDSEGGTTPAGSNPFTLSAIQSDQRQDQRVLLRQAIATNPDEAARAAKLAKQYPVPEDVLSRNLRDVEMQAAVDKADEQLQTSPRLAQYLRDKPFTAKQAHDDVGPLAAIEQFFRDTGGSAKAGVFNASKGSAGVFRAGAEFLAPALDFLEPVTEIGGNPLRRLAEGFDMLAQQNAASAKAAAPKTDGILSSGFQSGIQSLTQNTLMLPLAFLPGGQPAALAGMTTFTGGTAYQDARDKGLPMSQALPFAASQAAIEYATEKLPLGQLIGDVKAGTPIFQTLAKQIALEVPGEQIATILQDMNEWAVLNTEKPFSAYLEERPSAAAQTLVATIVGVGGNVAVGKGVESFIERGQRGAEQIEAAERSSRQLAAAAQLAAASKLRERNPDEFRALVQSMADNTEGAPKEVFVDAEVLNQLAPELLAQLPESVRAALPDALAANDAVAIPVGDVLTLAPGTPLEAILVENARLNGPESMSHAEAKQASAQAQEFLATESQRVIQQAVDQQATQESHDRVKQTLLERLNTVGRDSPAVNTTTATLYASMYTTLAGQLGITPEAAFQLYGVNLVGKTGQGAVLNTGTKTGELAVEGYHFSKADRPVISTAMFGTGLQGSGKDTYLNAADQRLRKRAYFYVDKGTGINPEAGVGGRGQRANLTNIYDSNADPLRLKTGRDQLGFESAVLDAGFSGYLDRLDGTQSGQVILLGDQNVRTEVLGPLAATRGQVVPAPQRTEAQGRDAIVEALNADKALPSGAPTIARWQELLAKNPTVLQAMTDAGVFSGDQNQNRYKSDLVKQFIASTEAPVYAQSLSSRLPSAVKSTEDPLANVLNITYDVVLADTKTLAKNVAALQALPNMRKLKGKGAKDPVRNVEAFIEHATNNLLWLHDHMPANMRDRARLWYDGGRKTVEAWAKRYGISEMQGAAAIAVLSPQNGWFANVSQAERIADMVFGLREYVWDDAMTAEAERISEGGQLDDKMQAAVGKSLGELLATPDIAARWVRVYDQTYNNRAYRVLTPEGGAADYVKTGAGADATMMWKSYPTIAKAISVLTDGRAENVHYQIGKEHKVRNFYNNIFAPNSELGYATIDTHAVAAALLRPLASADIEVAQAFGGGGSSSSAMTGLNGTYPIYLEAYRRAAEARGIQPRQMQSITWEAVRGLFEATAKQGMKAPANAIWGRYKAGEIEQAQAQQEILALAGDITPPAWTEVPFDDTVSRTYEGAPQVAVDSRPAAEGTESKVMFEVAPDPNDAVLTEEWNALTPAERLEISQRVAARIVPDVLKELGTGGDFVMQLGGYLGATNPSMTLRLERSELALTAAKMLGHALSQDSMMVVAETPFVGSEPVGAVTLLLPDGYGETEVSALYDRLWQLKNEQGQELVGGHTTSDGRMVILNYSSLSTEELGEVIDAHLGGEFEVTGDTVYSAFPTKEDYGYDVQNEPEGNTASRQSPAQRRPSDLRAAAAESLRAELDARRGTQADGTYAQGLAQRGAESFETTYTDKQGETYRIRLEQEVMGMGTDRALTVRVNAYQGDQRRARVDFDVQGNTLAAENTITAPAYRGRGLAEALYSAAREAGYDIMPGRKQTPDGEAMVARLREKGLINQERPLEQGTNALMSWFGTPGPDNNLVNEDGTPMVLYHGTTKAAVESLKSGSPFRRSKIGAMGSAVYLGDSAEASAGYNNGALIRVYARGKYLSNAKWSEYVGQHGWAGAEAAARADGYAGVYDRNYESAIAVWDPANIKAVDAAEFAETDNAYQQGPRGTFNPKTFELALNENSNMSTVHHEMGHAYLEIITKIASEPNAPQAIVDQVERFLKWRGITGDETVGGTALETWNAMTLDQKRPHHEALAENYENYLLTGKAPSIELQPLFRKLKAYMLNAYKTLKAFFAANPGVTQKLPPEMVQFYDRMLATEEQIAQAEEVAGLLPDEDATAEAVEKLTARSLRDLKWTVNARNKAIKALQKEAATLRKAVEAEVTAEVEAQPVYAARKALRSGTKLGIDELEALYMGEGDRYALLDWKPLVDQKLAGKTGMHPDIAADMFGFANGDALVRALLEAEPIASVVEGMTDQRMLERHGDLIDQRAIEEAANEAVHNEARARSLAAELRAQAEALNPRADTGEVNAKGSKITVNALAEAAKQFAENVVAKTPLKDLKAKAWQHTAAERRAGKRWQEATAKGETQEAVKAKQDQLLNNAAAKAALEAQGEMRKVLEFFKRVVKDGNEKTVTKGRDPDVVNAARAILGAYGVAPRTAKTATEYMDLVAKNDPAMHAALQPSTQAALNAAQPLEALTMDELRALHEEIQAMWHLAKRSRQMEVDGNLLDLDDAADELQGRMQEIGVPDSMPGDTRAITPAEKRARWLQHAGSLLRRAEQWAEGMDGKYGGPFLRLVFQPVKEAANRYRADRVKYRKAYQALVDAVAPALRKGPIAAPEINYTFGEGARSIGHAELLHAILHTGNDSNKRKLLLGRGWATENADGTLDTSKWDAFTTRMQAEGLLTKAHYDFAQGVWDLLEQTKPLAQKTHRDVFGRYFAEVTADEVVTPFGTYRGGYVPAQADPELVQDADLRKLAELENENMSYSFPATSKGFTKGRVEYNRPLLLNLRTIGQHIDKVLLFSHMEPAVRDVNKLLSQKGVSYSLGRIDQTVYAGMLTPWLNRSARQIVETPIMGDGGISRVLSAARGRAGMALMFANISNTLQQITGFSTAFAKLKADGLESHMMRATAQFISNPKEMGRSVAAASSFMDNRMENEIAAINDAMDDILLDQGLYEKSQAWTRKHAYFMQSAMANTMEPIIWTAGYNGALQKGMSETDAVRYADGLVRQTQGSTLPEDVSRIETGPAYARVFTQFIGYFNMMANTNATALKQIAQETGLKKGAGKALLVVTAGMLVPLWVAEAIAQAMRGGPDDEDDDGYLDDWLAAVFGMGTIKGSLAMVPFVGQLANAGINRMNSNPADDKVSLSPAVSLLESGVGVPKLVYQAMTDPDKINARNAVRDVASAISITTGLPAYAIARPLGYLAGVEQGKIEPTSELDMARGLVTGSVSPDSKQ